ncbi:hypothetical protein [Pseudomonas purpurea]|uniref:hypothetical protein n=1 Tax=Pseudomonas purpurea TaxID=3136737 RepID=UPI003262D03D
MDKTALSKKLAYLFMGVVCGLLLGAALMLFNGPSKIWGRTMLKTQEPFVIESPDNDGRDYRLPAGTVLYHDQNYAEGFTRYIVYFNYKGPIAHDEVPMEPKYGGVLIAPLWLSDVEGPDAAANVRRPAISRADVAAAVKSGEITRKDLQEILRTSAR